MITKQEFLAYEGVRVSGITNMFNIKLVCKISGLNREQCSEIMRNYIKLYNKYLNK